MDKRSVQHKDVGRTDAGGKDTGVVENGKGQVLGSLGEPFVIPDIETLEVKNGMPILPKIPGRVITMEMVKELSEEY